MIVVFSENWLEKKHNRISTFISSMFPGKAAQEYENENSCSDKNILQTVKELDKTGHDYFLIPEEVINTTASIIFLNHLKARCFGLFNVWNTDFTDIADLHG